MAFREVFSSVFMLWGFYQAVITPVMTICLVSNLQVVVLVNENSESSRLDWVNESFLQHAMETQKQEFAHLRATKIELVYILNGSFSSVAGTLDILCRDVVNSTSGGINGMLSALELDETEILTRLAGAVGLTVLSTWRTHALSKYSNYVPLLPLLSDQASVVEVVVGVMGVDKYHVICTAQQGGDICGSLQTGNNTWSRVQNTRGVTSTLAQVKFSGARVIVLDCDANETHDVLRIAWALEMTDAQYLWILTESALRGLSRANVTMVTPPPYMLGVRLNIPASDIANEAAYLYLQATSQHVTKACAAGVTTFSKVHTVCVNKTAFNPVKFLPVAADSNTKHSYSIVHRVSDNYTSTATGDYIGQFQPVATWTSSRGIPTRGTDRLRKIYRQLSRHGNSDVPHVRIVTIEHGMYTFQVRNVYPKCASTRSTCTSRDLVCEIGVPCQRYSANSSAAICISGLMIELLKLIQRDVHFTYDVYLVRDGKYGSIDPGTGQWNGMIGDIISGEADMALATLTITASRTRVVDFSAPYGEVGIGILARTDSDTDQLINMDFLSPLGLPLWLVILSTIATVMVVLWILDRKSWQWYLKGRAHFIQEYKERVTFLESMSYAWSTFVQIQAGRGFPRSLSARLVAVPFAMAMIIVSSSYTAELAANKVKEQIMSPITGIFDDKMLNPPPGFRYATLKDSSTEAYFRFSEDARLRRIYEHMKDNTVRKVEDGVAKLLSGEFKLYIDDQPYLEHLVSSSGNCALRMVGETFGISGYGVALKYHSRWTAPISRAIIKLNDHSTLSDLWNKWLKRKCVKHEEFGKLPSGMTIPDVNGLFVVLAAGAVLGLIFLGIEYVIFCLRRLRKGAKEIGGEPGLKNEYKPAEETTVTPLDIRKGIVNEAFDACNDAKSEDENCVQ